MIEGMETELDWWGVILDRFFVFSNGIPATHHIAIVWQHYQGRSIFRNATNAFYSRTHPSILTLRMTKTSIPLPMPGEY